MPTKPITDNDLITLFLSAYEHGSWADAHCIKLDDVVRTKQAVDQLATRKSDGKTLAIEHTVIEPFVGDKEDFAFFKAVFLEIESDKSLRVPGRSIQVFVPVGTLRNQPEQASRDAIVKSVHSWIKLNRLAFRDGASQHPCRINGVPNKPPFDITLNLKVVSLQHGPDSESGILHIRRQQVDSNIGAVVEKALKKKVPKLVNTAANKHILLLERQHMNLYQQTILDEIEKQRASYPDLARVDEIWMVETFFYGTAFGGTYLRFEQYENGNEVGSFDFNCGKLVMKFEDGVGEAIRL